MPENLAKVFLGAANLTVKVLPYTTVGTEGAIVRTALSFEYDRGSQIQ